MALLAEKDLLKNIRTIILFYSNTCKYCVDYKKVNWPKLVKAAEEHAEILEINVADPQNQENISLYHQGGIPNTVFLDENHQILISNPGNFDTSRLAQEFESMHKYGFEVTRSRRDKLQNY